MSGEAVLISDLRPDGYGIVPLSVATCAELREVGERALRVWLVLVCRSNDRRGGWAWSITALANDTGIDRRHVQRAVVRLEEVGLLVKQSGGGRASTFYRLTVPPSLAEKPMDKPNRPAAKKAAAGAAESAAPRHPTEPPTIQDPPNPPQAGGKGTTPATRGERVAELMHRDGLTRRKASQLLEREEGHLATWERVAGELHAQGVRSDPFGRCVQLIDLQASGFTTVGERWGPLLADAWRNLDEAALQTLGTFGRWKLWQGRRFREPTWSPPPWRELEPWMILVALDRALAWADAEPDAAPGSTLARVLQGLDMLDGERWTRG